LVRASVYRLSNRQQRSILRVELDDHRVAKGGVRHPIAQHHQPRHPPTLSPPGIRDVQGLIGGVTRAVGLLQDRDSSHGCIVAEDAIVTAGGIFMISQSEKEHSAQHNPQRVEQPEVAPHARYHSRAMTRDEIQQKLIEIVRQEKDIPDDKLTLETVLAEAGVDSLDALTILFAIEEQFHISIPDDKARAIKTFGDMVTVVEELQPR
jgi:acyl carrier protein